MTFEEIKELHGMGFTAEQIMNLTGDRQPEKQPETPPEEQPETPPADDARITGLEKKLSDSQKEIANLTKQIQALNRQTARIENMPDDLQKQTDAIMAELIRPSYKKGEDQK